MSSQRSIQVGTNVLVGPGEPCFMVAEIGNNHQGDVSLAREMVHAAAEAKAQAVKFQKRNTKALLTAKGRMAPYNGNAAFGPTYGEHRDALELSVEDMAQLKELAESLGLVFFASVWDMVSLKEMAGLQCGLIKVSSADMVSLPLLRAIGKLHIPVFLSTGMSSLEEIDAAVAELKNFHNQIVLLHCNSTYPCPEDEIGLPVIRQLAQRYRLPVGYSGHEAGIGPSVASTAFGACVVERHFTMDKTLRGTDHKASLEPEEFGRMAAMIREVEAAMRVTEKKVFPSEAIAAGKLRKSVIFARDLPAGHVLTEKDILAKCPGGGVSPLSWEKILGCKLLTRVGCEEAFEWGHVSKPDAKAADKKIDGIAAE
ncbi:MAG: N-acetylneuraminate synthase family protein [Desulfovibrionaceae bacterium]